MNTYTLNKKKVMAKAITAIAATAASVALPQVFHLIGVLSATGAAAGTVFLPMHIPVLLAGLLAGPWVGLIAGLLSPILSFAISGMPVLALLPAMTVELAVYGLVAGLMSKTKLPVAVQLTAAMIGGRLARALAVLVSVNLIGGEGSVIGVWDATVAGLPGIALQLVIIPLLIYRLKGLKKLYE